MPDTTDAIELTNLPDALRERSLRYALSVITSRALPDVRDGQKPVQRRILYSMDVDFGLGRPDAKAQKSAKVVGRVMGDYHPHGDQAIYEALVRMAQPFSLRYPVVDGVGNFGTIQGDPPAAQRYSECRLRPIASDLMTLLGEDTVPFRPNYDASKQEPVVLPVPAPLLLMNGSTGIAVGMATNIPPHNAGEVCRAAAQLIDDPDATVAQLLRIVKGPDFPTGGEVLTKRAELREIYETGKGSFKVRGSYRIEEGARGRSSLVITSIPWGTSADAVLGAIAAVVREKRVPHATDVRDETTAKDGHGVRIVVELKKDADPRELAAYLYKHTPLQETFGVNLTCLVPTENPLVGRPAVLDLKGVLRHFLDFRLEVVTRSLRFRLRKLEERIHLLEGFAKVYGALDEALAIVRKAEDKADAAKRLSKRFGLDELQADAVLELKVYRLARLEIEAIRKELEEKRAEAKRLSKLLRSEPARYEIVRKDLLAFAAKHQDERRTRMLFSDDAELVYDEDAFIAKEDTNVVVTRQGLVKRVARLKDPGATRVREGDSVGWIAQGSTRENVVFFSNGGTAFATRIHEVAPSAGYGDPIQKLFKFGDGERVVSALSLDPRVTPSGDLDLLVATARGHVLRTALAPHREASTRAGRRFARLGEGDEVLSVELVGPKAKEVLVVSQRGVAHRFRLEEVPKLEGVGKGLRAVKLAKGDRLLAATQRSEVVVETTRGGRETIGRKDVEAGERGGEGTVVKRRFGFAREVPPDLRIVELEAEAT